MKTIDTTNMCRKLFEGEYRAIRKQIENDPTLTAVVRSRQLHIYRDGKKSSCRQASLHRKLFEKIN